MNKCWVRAYAGACRLPRAAFGPVQVHADSVETLTAAEFHGRYITSAPVRPRSRALDPHTEDVAPTRSERIELARRNAAKRLFDFLTKSGAMFRDARTVRRQQKRRARRVESRTDSARRPPSRARNVGRHPVRPPTRREWGDFTGIPDVDLRPPVPAREHQGEAVNFNWLPAWRWPFPSFHTNFGLGISLNPVMMGLASFFFQIAGVIWYILLALVKLATEGDILNSAAKTLDGIFHDVAKPIVQSPYLLGALVVFVGIWTVWRVLKHGYGHAIRKLFQALVPLALVGIIFNAAASDNGTGRVPFSPAWIVKGVDSLSNQLGKITFVALTPPQQANAPSCEQYEAGLQAEFASNASSTTNTAVPEAMNDLWEQSYLYAWGAAQFYDANTGKRVDCRVLESANNVDPSTQSIVQQLGSTQASMPANPPGWNKTIFNDTGMSDALTATATAFAACQYVDGQWQVTKAGLLNTSAGDGPTANDCSVWWHGKVAASGSFPDNGAAFCSACNGQTLGQINGEQAPGDPLGTEFLNAYNGNNSGSAVVYGFFALISALFYAFALGALTLGTFLAQFILIAVLCALPLLLIAMAVSDRAEEMAHRIVLIGARTMVAKTVFLIVIGLLTTLVEVANSLVGGAGNGLGVVFAAAIAPLLAFAGLHMLMKQFNMHGMLSLKGAVLTTAGFAMYKHYREDQSPRPGAESALASARNRIRHPLRSGTLGRRRTDASRPGGARPPEAGTHHRSRLYKNRSGENGESQAGARSGNGSGDGAGESGTEELATPAPAAPTIHSRQPRRAASTSGPPRRRLVGVSPPSVPQRPSPPVRRHARSTFTPRSASPR